MTISDEITIIANQIANQGKKPTVALVKTKLRNPAPLPTIISILKNWTHDPKHINLTTESEDKAQMRQGSTAISPEIKKAIELALQPMENEIAELKALIIKLIKQQQ